MKHLVSLIFLLFTGLHALQLHAQDVKVQTSGTDKNLYSIHFTDQHYGWAAGEAGTLLSTTDGGESWTLQQTRFTDTFRSVRFFDEFTGWVSGDDNLLIHTNDSGRRWSDRRPSPVSGQNLYSLHAFDWNRLITAGGPGSPVHYSSNGGTTWSQRHRDTTEGVFSSIHFRNTDNGVAITDGRVAATDNGGRSWNTVYEANGGKLRDAVITTVGDIFFILSGDETGNVMHIPAGSEEAAPVFETVQSGLRALALSGDDRLSAVSKSGSVYGSDDGGRTWFTLQERITDNRINSIHLSEQGTIWLAGDSGSIIRLQNDLLPVPFREREISTALIASEEQAVELLNRSLRYAEKAEQADDPGDRRAYYIRVRKAVISVQEYYRDQQIPGYIAERLTELPVLFRAVEHNAGAELYSEFRNREYDPDDAEANLLLRKASGHFKNAILLLPDSTESMFSLAYMESLAGNSEDAIYWLERVFGKTETQPKERHDLLVRLYLESDRIDEARNAALSASEIYPEERLFLEYLAEMDLASPGAGASPETLDRLIDADPENPQYRYVRGTRTSAAAFEKLNEIAGLYEELWRLGDALLGASDESEQDQIRRQIRQTESRISGAEREGNRLSESAETDLKRAVENAPEFEDAHFVLGVLSLNRAAVLEEIRMFTPDEQEASRLDARITGYLEKSMEHFESTVAVNPRNREAWEELYKIYLLLGKEDDARRARQRL
jgi:photosystem II stability/assembly factor-like uncharacterized protein/DNA-binding SARP family transcriptional activator